MRNLIQIAEDAIPTHQHYIEEMTNLGPRATGLPLHVYVSPKGGAIHDARIKVFMPPWETHPVAVYALRPFRHLEGDNSWMTKEQEQQLKEWVELNFDVIMGFWNRTISTEEDLRERLIGIKDAAYAIGAINLIAPKVEKISWHNQKYNLYFRFMPNYDKIANRFLSAGYKQKIELHKNNEPVQGIILWSR